MKRTNSLLTLIVIGMIFSISALAQGISPFDLLNLKNQGLGNITAYEKIKIIDAWDKIEELQPSPALSPVAIGIFDTGIDLTHPEFRQVSIDTPTIVDFRKRGHGTQVTGIIGANNLSFSGQYTPPHMNGILSGVRGLDYTLRIRLNSALKEFTTSTDGFRYFKTLDQLARSPGGIQVINGSFGAPLCSELSILQRIIRRAKGLTCYKSLEKFLTDKDIYIDLVNQYPGVIFVFAAGNDRIDSQFHLPGGGVSAANTITVAATGLNDKRATFDPLDPSNSSSFGSRVDISAPGIAVYSPAPRGKGTSPPDTKDYDQFFNGTSAAAPMVTGVAGILKALEPEYQKFTPGLVMNPQTIKETLIASADPIFTNEPDKRLGSGCFNETALSTGCRLNAHRAVAWFFSPASTTLAQPTDITTDSIALSWTNPLDFDFTTPDFDSYKVFRSTSSPVTLESTLVETIDDVNQTTFTDTNLQSDTGFFYKVFVFDKTGLSTGSNKVSATTLPAGPPPTPVNLFQLFPRFTAGNYIGLFWRKNADPNFASYKIFRDTTPNVDTNDTLVVTLTNQNQIYFKDDGLAPNTYFYKVFTFSQAGLSSASNELSGRVFAAGEVITRIPGVPEPGDTQFPLDVAVPSFFVPVFIFDCPRSPVSPFTCLGPFSVVSFSLDEFGHQRKFRFFNVSLNNLQINNQPNLKFKVHRGDLIQIRFTAQDQDYQVFVPFKGLFQNIPKGQTRPMSFGVTSLVPADIIVQTATDINPTAGIIKVFP